MKRAVICVIAPPFALRNKLVRQLETEFDLTVHSGKKLLLPTPSDRQNLVLSRSFTALDDLANRKNL
jgi:hypothetical protein